MNGGADKARALLEQVRSTGLGLSHWTSEHATALAVQRRWDTAAPTLSAADQRRMRAETAEAYRRRVRAIWGIAAHGAMAIQYAVSLLKTRRSDEMQDAGQILTAMSLAGQPPDLEGALVEATLEADDAETVDVLLDALAHGEVGERSLRLISVLCERGSLDPDTQEQLRVLAAKAAGESPPAGVDLLQWIERLRVRTRV